MSHVVLGVIDYQEAKRIRAHLEEMGVRIELVGNPETCAPGKSCKPTVEVHVLETDLPKVMEFFRKEKERDLGGVEVDPNLVAQVFDSDQEEAVCPACGTRFRTTAKECPDCGLVFIGEGME